MILVMGFYTFLRALFTGAAAISCAYRPNVNARIGRT
jgi:hypothetical protein